jgi:hypothetical protein
MKRLFAGSLLVVLGIVLGRLVEGQPATASGVGIGAGVAACSARSGDVNADGSTNISDALTLLNHLFVGTPAALAPLCTLPPKLPPPEQMEGRFVDNGDGTVTDNATGLMWQKASVGEHSDAFTWGEAIDYCAGLELAGHTDWRLPNVRELESLVMYDKADLMIDSLFEATPWYEYWTSTALPGAYIFHAYMVNLESPGHEQPILHRQKDYEQGNVRAVRSAQ